jgi:sialate O-acetylesterase|uniref:sialate O-acetylesterase n=1 Tax=Cephaloticoccus sp. TaxID=1985742 RepID=UPI004049AC88
MPKLHAHFVAIILGLSLGVSHALADVTLAPLFQDHAVLQSSRPLPIWGRAAAGEHVTVTFRGQMVGATADKTGKWIVYLAAIAASSEPADLTVTGNTTMVVQDVLVGEVWLASGQSNMNRKLSSLPNAAEVTAKINNPLLRHININLTASTEPADQVDTSGWQLAAPTDALEFSAVAWFFADEIQRKLGVPVGIIHSSWGGSTVEAWMSAPTLQSTAAWPAIDARWQHLIANYPEIETEYAAWLVANKAAKAKGLQQTPPPILPHGHGSPHAISELFNGMIAPLQPYAIRGVIWYQGESNWERSTEYAELFPTMIRSWRAQWGQGDFPFYFVQLPDYDTPYDPTNRGWAFMREAQTPALVLPQTGMAVTVDCGDPADIHPQNKPIVGQRLARIAEAKVYRFTGDWSGPIYQSFTSEGTTLRIKFDHVDSGLISDRHPPQSFELAGEDRKFHPATAEIKGDTIIVQSPAVPHPIAVRYAWSNVPKANLYNGAGLPAVPFRSDNW